MAFRALIQANVASAFNIVGDLAETVTLTTTAPGSFNLATGTRTEGPAVTDTVKAVVGIADRDTDGDAISANIILSIPSHTISTPLSEYTTVTRPGNVLWDVVEYVDDGFITQITIRRPQQ